MNHLPENILELKPIAELVDPPLRFRVEKYQRGYKWGQRQVEDLLDDIDTFRKKMPGNPTHPEFYSLQPVVVKWRADLGQWELIDGQQRLTTIYLILLRIGKPRFEMDYQTRPHSARFLRDVAGHGITRDSVWSDFIAREPSLDNIDNHHFFAACQAIDEWFSTHDPEAFHGALLYRTQVIWYEVLDTTEPRDIFLRLNSGKIELTSAELVKALFLRGNPSKSNDEDRHLRQAEIASEWDRMEHALQDDRFWFFIHRQPGKNMPSVRIEFLLDLVAGRDSFRYFEKATAADLDAAWKDVAQRFELLQEWYWDHALYHRVGFLLTCGPEGALARLLQTALRSTKPAFADHVASEINAKVSKIPLNELAYHENDETLTNVLLLFNIETLIASSSNARFPFDRHKAVQWSLEHIHAQNSKALSDQQERETWYDHYHQLLLAIDRQNSGPQAVELLGELTRWHDNKSNAALEAPPGLEEKINRLADARKVGDFDDGDDDPMHGIGNLALLERGANSALGNDIFRLKRKKILDMNRGGKDFVPPATKDVFLKYYTPDPKQTERWDRTDRAHYRAAAEWADAASAHPYWLKATNRT